MMVIRTTMDVSVLAAGRGSRPRKMMPAIEDLYSRYADRTWAEQWCGRGDLNPHAFWAPPPQDGVSANFTTSAHTTGSAKTVFQAGRRGSSSIAKTMTRAKAQGSCEMGSRQEGQPAGSKRRED